MCPPGDLREDPRTLTLEAIADVRRAGREQLEGRIAYLVRELTTLERTLREAQATGTRLHDELVEAKAAWPHWICPSCRAFNGEAKESLPRCRACGSSREARTG